jgi:hypothetical protein
MLKKNEVQKRGTKKTLKQTNKICNKGDLAYSWQDPPKYKLAQYVDHQINSDKDKPRLAAQ